MKFAAAKLDINALRSRAASGEIIVAYLDEAGFSCVHPNRGAWTPIGSQHLIQAIRGPRLNVLGAMMSTGELESISFTGNMTSEIFLKFLKDISEKYDKPITFILDNASFHKSKLVAEKLFELEEKGVSLYFISPYSPELNRIEKLWGQMKHVWMEAKCRTIDVLEQDVGYILENFGEKFNLSF